MNEEIEKTLETANAAQQLWAAQLLRPRLRAIVKIASLISERFDELVDVIPRPNADRAERLASEVLPLADACRYTASVGRQVLSPRKRSFRSGAWWMGRISVSQMAEPWGTVLVLSPGNYPLLLPGVQMVQAVAAGNAVLVKPSPGCEEVLHRFRRIMIDAGVPENVVQVLPPDVEYAQGVMSQGVDKVILTGSVDTGRAVLRQLAETLTPSTMELSGCDAVFVLPQADLTPVVDCLDYALRLNGGATCIGPRRIFVTPTHSDELKKRLVEKLQAEEFSTQVSRNSASRLCSAVQQAIAAGAKQLCGKLPNEGVDRPAMHPIILSDVRPDMLIARSDIFAPVVSVIDVPNMASAIDADRVCPYSLGASIFGPRTYADHWAGEVEAGCIVVNDIIVPTADPRVSFGGRDHSGWGVTRGKNGLMEMTRNKTVCTRVGSWRPHLDKKNGSNADLLIQLLKIFHAGRLATRFEAAKRLFSIVREQK